MPCAMMHSQAPMLESAAPQATEDFMVHLFEDTNLCAIHAKRVTISKPSSLLLCIVKIPSHGNLVCGSMISCSHHCLVQCPRICSLPDVSGVRWLEYPPIDRLLT